METIAIASVVMSVASAGMGIVQGVRASQAAALEEAQIQDEAKTIRLAAEQEEVRKLKSLRTVLANNEAIRGAAGLSFSSGSADALRASNIADAESDMRTLRLNRDSALSRNSYQALAAGMRKTSGLFSGVGAFVSGIGNAATGAMRYGGTTSAEPSWFERGLKG